jgi:hypothetical protein
MMLEADWIPIFLGNETDSLRKLLGRGVNDSESTNAL